MKLKRLIGGNLESNGYIVYNKEGGEGYIIDPGYNAKAFLTELTRLGISVRAILLTHHHYDHVSAADKVASALDCPILLHRGDWGMYKGKATGALEEGDSLPFGDEALQVIHTPGHTEGGVCLACETSKAVFTGDTVFNVDLGRTDLSDGSDDAMADSIRNVVSKWGNDITIYPGHGDSATMKYVREHNEEYRQFGGE